jgi:uncharacterized protein YjbI with pentapeptide repeats
MNSAYALTASEFVSKYQNQFSEGEKVHVLVKVKGEPSTFDPIKRAKEIRYYQSGVLKFIHFAGATNVISDTAENQFTAFMAASLAEKVSTRYDVISVTVIDGEGQTRDLCAPIVSGADLSGCDLYGARLPFADLRGINFTGANLKGADFTGADLSGADMRGSFLKYALINGANLTDANLAFAKLIRAELVDSDMSGANFYRATLYRADFTNADLSNTDFRYSILTFAVLANANLQGANLEGAGTWNTNLNKCYNHEICE